MVNSEHMIYNDENPSRHCVANSFMTLLYHGATPYMSNKLLRHYGIQNRPQILFRQFYETVEWWNPSFDNISSHSKSYHGILCKKLVWNKKLKQGIIVWLQQSTISLPELKQSLFWDGRMIFQNLWTALKIFNCLFSLLPKNFNIHNALLIWSGAIHFWANCPWVGIQKYGSLIGFCIV